MGLLHQPGLALACDCNVFDVTSAMRTTLTAHLAPAESPVRTCLALPLPRAQVQQRVSAAENFNAVLSKAHKFYEAQISGKQPNWNRMSTDNPGGWRGDSHLLDGKTIGENLQGGFYDAGGKCATAAALCGPGWWDLGEGG